MNSSSLVIQARATLHGWPTGIGLIQPSSGRLFFGFLPSGFLISLLFIEVFLTQGLTKLKFPFSYFNSEQGFAFPTSERTLKNVFGDKKTAV
jgi:hypothetical protein